jgi:E3 ubiquitin-protein ligase RNF115/126
MQDNKNQDININIRTITSETKNIQTQLENINQYYRVERPSPLFNHFSNENSERLNIRYDINPFEEIFLSYHFPSFEEYNFQNILNSFFDQNNNELKKDNSIKLKVDKIKKENDIQEECVICGNNMCKKEEITILKKCNHTFHYNCIIEWGKYKQSCPVCRGEIPKYDN